MTSYKYKYKKYKYKYLELKQKGGEVLSTISKKNFESIFQIDFNFAFDIDFIKNENKNNDNFAIELMAQYDDYMDEEEENEQEENEQENQNLEEVQQVGGFKINISGLQKVAKNIKNLDKQQILNKVQQENNDKDENKTDITEQTTNDINENDNLDDSNEDDSNLDYDYPEDDDDPINILKELDIKSWNPLATLDNQYYLVKIIDDDNNYLLKIVSSNFKYEFKKNMEDYDDEYGKLMKMKNILAPLFLFKDDENIVCGYLFLLDEDYVDLNNFLDENDDISEINFMKILKEISLCFINVFKCGLKPCAKKNSIMIKNDDDTINCILTGADGLLGCTGDIEEETVRDISKFFDLNKIPIDIKNSLSFNKIFKLSDYGLSLKNNIVTVRGLYEKINKIIEEL